MSNTLSLKPKKLIINFGNLTDLINDLFKTIVDDKTSKKKPLKLLAAHINSLIELPLNTKLSFDERESLSKIALGADHELKTLVSLLVASANCRHPEVRKEVLSFACNVVNNIKFLNPTADTNIFLLKDISETNSGYLARLVMQLKSRFEKYQGDNYKPAQKRTLEANVLAIAHIWAFENGKADIDTTLSNFSRVLTDSATLVENNKIIEIEADEQAKTGMVYFLASQTNSSNLKDFSSILSYFKAKQEAAQNNYNNTQRAISDWQLKYQDLEGKNETLRIESLQKDALIKQLTSQITALNEQNSESKQSLTAQKVHLKDDTSKAKAKALNFLEEEVLLTLQNSFKALDRETPKIHIALHNLDVMIERVEEELEWFKK